VNRKLLKEQSKEENKKRDVQPISVKYFGAKKHRLAEQGKQNRRGRLSSLGKKSKQITS